VTGVLIANKYVRKQSETDCLRLYSAKHGNNGYCGAEYWGIEVKVKVKAILVPHETEVKTALDILRSACYLPTDQCTLPWVSCVGNQHGWGGPDIHI
jgi:hypothetical protein